MNSTPAVSNRSLCDREVVDVKSHHRTFAKELVVFVLRAVNMDFGAVLQLEPSGRVINGQNVQAQYVSIELVHSVELLSLCSIQPRRITFIRDSNGRLCGRTSALSNALMCIGCWHFILHGPLQPVVRRHYGAMTRTPKSRSLRHRVCEFERLARRQARNRNVIQPGAARSPAFNDQSQP